MNFFCKSNQFVVIIATLYLVGFIPQSQAAQPTKANVNHVTKERLVLMPLRLSNTDQSLQGAMETALVQGLQLKYEVFSGEQVSQKAREIFLRESRNTAKKECDETRCMQGIAEAFQAELIATANVNKKDGGYFLALSVQNIFDNKIEFSNSVPCESCSLFQVINKLKELSGGKVPVSDLPSADDRQLDGELWAEAKKGNRLEDYQAYLEAFPNGKYVPFAKANIKIISEAKLSPSEQQAWAIAQKDNNAASYDLYLQDYPNGYFAGLAKELSEKLNSIKEKVVRNPEMVHIPGRNYEIGKYVLTQAEWWAVIGSKHRTFTSCGDDCPVENTSWQEVQTFIEKLNAKSGKHYRLPTEVEWEFACYGGNQLEDCRGKEVNSLVGNGKINGEAARPVGQKQANGYGLYDMGSDIVEWMSHCVKRDYCSEVVLAGDSRTWQRNAGRGVAVTSRRDFYRIRLARSL